MKQYAGTTELARALVATVSITGLSVAAFAAGLVLGMNAVMAIGAAVITWMATAVMVWLARPRFLGPTVVALPLILIVTFWILIAMLTSPAR